MSDIITMNNQTTLNNGVKVICNLDVPDLGDSVVQITDTEILKFEEMITSQYLGAIENVINYYKRSPLPIKFIEGQEIIVVNLNDYEGLYGLFHLVRDKIIVDANTIIGINRYVHPEFLFSHEMGHKIQKYRANEEVYRAIANVLGISYYGNEYIIRETYSDECGNMASPVTCEHGILPCPLDPYRREKIKSLILDNIYR